MINKFLLTLLLIQSSSAFAWNQFEWEGKPTVYIVNSGSCEKAICSGLAKQILVGTFSTSSPTYGSALCGAVGNAEDGFTCPDAQECMDETTQGITIGKYKNTVSNKKNSIYSTFPIKNAAPAKEVK